MSTRVDKVLTRQHLTAWQLLDLHLTGLTSEECLWRPSPHGPHVTEAHGVWVADWPERETYDVGAASIAWLTWHVGFWWSMVFNHSFGDATLDRAAVTWPGSADGARAWLEGCHYDWVRALSDLPSAAYEDSERTRWPFRDRPFADVVAWVNVELMKNAAEIGYARFLFGASPT